MMTEVSSEKLFLYPINTLYIIHFHIPCGSFLNAFSTMQGDLLLAKEYIFSAK